MATTAASVGTTANIANSAVPAARIGISPSNASRAARSQRATIASLVFIQAITRIQGLTCRSYATIGCDVIDTHCHLDLDACAADRDQAVARAGIAGVIDMLVPAIRPRTWAALVELCARRAASGMRCALGIHPQIVPELVADE